MTNNLTEQNFKQKGRLKDRTLYINRMSEDGSSALAAAYRSIGVDCKLSPKSNSESIDLARQFTTGEECYPEIVTLGSYLMVLSEPDFVPEKTAFMMPTAGGPCRFGQYKQLLEKILHEKGFDEIMILSPTSANGYEGIGDDSGQLFRLAWWSLICSDALRKLLLQTRPYEINEGDTDRVHEDSLDMLCKVIERQDLPMKEKFIVLVETMNRIGMKFSGIAANYETEKPLVGVVGEIFCRLDDFANAFLIKRIEKFGGEVWLAPITEWVWYTNYMSNHDLKFSGETFSKKALKNLIKSKIQMRDEHKLIAPLHKRFQGYEEPKNTGVLLKPAVPYLPYWGALGEMVLNVGGTIYLHGKGADGIVDISPFTCMNGIVCEAIYPKISKEYNNIPIRNFYFDGAESDYDRDVEIFLELASTYKRRKKVKRVYPAHFAA